MTYELVNKEVQFETPIDDEKYQVDILLTFKSSNELIPDFVKTITVISDNSQTGYEADEQREIEINAYISDINK